jgi:mono/diheme cytochrome c family protein
VNRGEVNENGFARRRIPRIARRAKASLLAFFVLSACQKSPVLPEQGTYAQQLYVKKCGTCHRPYNPQSMTAAMWEMQMEVMRTRIRQAGQSPLTPEQNRIILDYLRRNAGRQ